MKAIVALLLLCLLQVNLAEEQQEVERAGGEGGSLQPAGVAGLLVREDREARRRKRNSKKSGDKKTGRGQGKSKNEKKTGGGKKATEKQKNGKGGGRAKVSKKQKNNRKGKGRNKATKKQKKGKGGGRDKTQDKQKNIGKGKGRKKTKKKNRNKQNRQNKQTPKRKKNKKPKNNRGNTGSKGNGRKGKKGKKPKGIKHNRRKGKKGKNGRKKGIKRQGGNSTEAYTCSFYSFARSASVALTQSERAKRTPKFINKINKQAGKNYESIFNALSTACTGDKLTETVKETILLLKDNCSTAAIKAKCNPALVTVLTPALNKTITDCQPKVLSFNSEYKLALFKNSGGDFNNLCTALEAITPTVATLTAEDCFNQPIFQNATAEAVTVFKGCQEVIRQCNQARNAAVLALVPCLSGGGMVTTTGPPGGRNLRHNLVERLFNKH